MAADAPYAPDRINNLGGEMVSLVAGAAGGGYALIRTISGLVVQQFLPDAAGSNFVFRGVNTSPETVFSQGFQPQGTSMDLLSHALDSSNPPSGYVATSTSPSVAGSFGSNIYVIRTPTNAINVNGALGLASPFPGELEVAIPGPISGSQIRAVTQPSQGISFLNPGYVP